MSLTRKCIDRKYFAYKQPQLNAEFIKSLPNNHKRETSATRKSKSKDKNSKIIQQRTTSLRDQSSSKNGRYRLDRSKESKESRESLLKSTQSYYISQAKKQRSGSAVQKQVKSSKSKEITNTSNIVNSTFQMQSLMSTHKKKKSNFSSTIGSKFDLVHLNKSALNHSQTKGADSLSHLLIKSQTILDQYRTKYEALEKQNKKYKKKYQQALKKIRNLENKY